jgi:acetylornithine deacetylase/succinyl-diaminopimelate desuccinylase-like protein
MKNLIQFLFLFISAFSIAQTTSEIKGQVRHSIDELRDFVAIPNDANMPADINRNITWLTEKFSDRGFNTAVLPTDGLPLFFAALPMDPDKKTLLFYMHLDGQPVAPELWDQDNPYEVVLKRPVGDQWETTPFDELNEDIPMDWRLYGRSTSDDKGPIVMLLNSLDLLKKNKVTLPFNIKVVLDGEEEKSSKPLAKAVNTYKDLLEADYLIINDGPVHASGQPTIVYGCRGITTLRVWTYGPIKPQHSGHYGNYAPNPAFEMAHLLSSLKSADGRALVEGYYDSIVLNDSDKAVLKAVPDAAEYINELLGIHKPDAVGTFYQEALQFPSLNVRGMASGWVGDQARTIVPDMATAEIDLRLVPETDGARLQNLVEAHLKKQGYTIFNEAPTKADRMAYPKVIRLEKGSVTPAFRTDLSLPFGGHLKSLLEDNFNSEVVQIRTMGGTVPIAPFVNALKIPAYIIPMVNPDNNQHSPNENLKIGQIEYGIKTFYKVLSSPFE